MRMNSRDSSPASRASRSTGPAPASRCRALPVIGYNDLEEAIRAADDSPSGLDGSVWSSGPEKARAVASQLDYCTVWINKHGMIQPNTPFNGTKMSGLGVELGQEVLLEYTDILMMIL
ncbi:Aldehyde dehydrogenase family [Pannonibacter indicus]|uniref:Aldehyde dehydrogenase family n=1 Tax=Pannonibacter indicus TaxID=466044 RepID=A0A0K6HQQ2_9HYPH|nr:aldehyde dehydrogenase family protein [Pannonibacter indicus]CUA93204.1 Aldehyde dehydrogenase family [Pannonibacter indicus]